MGRPCRAIVLIGVLAASALAPAGAAAPQAVSQLPVGYWRLDEAGGPTAAAAIGTLNGTWNGTITPVTTPLPPLTYNNQNGNVSRAVSFVGAQPDDFIEIANGAGLENLQEASYSLSAWFRPASIPPGVDAAWNAAYGILLKAGYHEGLVYGNGQHLQFDHWATGNVWAGTGSWANNVTAALNEWHHALAVWDRAAGQTRIYLDGALQGTGAAAADNRDYAQNPWRIGIAYPGAGGNYAWPMDGMIDDVRVYNFALTAPQADILWRGVPMVQQPVVATGGVQQVTVTWTAPAEPPGYPYTYNIFRSIDGGPFAPLASGVMGTSYTDPTATTTTGAGPTYTYQVTAVSVAESGTQTSTSAVPILPIPRTEGHDEGFFDDNCACGSTIPASSAAWAWLALLGLLARRR
ncbi:MAG TPA: LamG domain-containing protein [Planctomycetota bacterium]